MSIMGRFSKWLIRRMFDIYFTARAQQASHQDALWLVAYNACSKSQDKAALFWYRFWQTEDDLSKSPLLSLLPDHNQEIEVLKRFIFLLMHDTLGNQSRKINLTQQIEDVYRNSYEQTF